MMEDESREDIRNDIKTDGKVGLMGKGFFYQNQNDDYDLVYPTNDEKPLPENQQNEENPSRRKRKYRDVNLQSYKDRESVHVVNVGLTHQKQETNPEQDPVLLKTKRRMKRKLQIAFDDEDEEQVKEDSKPMEEEKVEKQKQSSQDVQIEQQKQIQQKGEEEQKIQRKKSQNDEPSFDEQQLTTFPSIRVHSSIPFKRLSTFIIKRQQSWGNKLHPIFHLHFAQNNKYFISAKQTSNNATSTFIASHDQKDFRENGCNYVGKIKTNVIGNIINIFGPGYSPTDVKSKQLMPRQLLATVHYETNFFGVPKPRQFTVYALKPQVSYNNNLYGVKLGNEEIPLNELYKNPDNQSNIQVLKNRKAQWNLDMGAHVLNFNGRVKKASIKNFILQDPQQDCREALVFGKLNDESFILDITSQISPYVALGCALSTFGSKIGCE